MSIKKVVTRRAFAAAGALIAARGGLIKPTTLWAQEAGPAGEFEYPPDVEANPVELAVQDSYTFLVIGLDTRDISHTEMTDVIMISRVELANRRVRTISVPRDLYSEIPEHGFGKINAAYSIGAHAGEYNWNTGMELVWRTIEWNFNLKIDGIVSTNLLKMPGVIDAIGGVTVNNPYAIHDDFYPTPDYGVKRIEYPEGELRLNGEQALEFSRTRRNDHDGGRIMRQHLVLDAALHELQNPQNLTNLSAIVEEGREFVKTTIPAEVQGQLVAALPDIDPELVAWGQLEDHMYGDYIGEGWYWITDWSYLPAHVRGWLGVGYLDPNRP